MMDKYKQIYYVQFKHQTQSTYQIIYYDVSNTCQQKLIAKLSHNAMLFVAIIYCSLLYLMIIVKVNVVIESVLEVVDMTFTM